MPQAPLTGGTNNQRSYSGPTTGSAFDSRTIPDSQGGGNLGVMSLQFSQSQQQAGWDAMNNAPGRFADPIAILPGPLLNSSNQWMVGLMPGAVPVEYDPTDPAGIMTGAVPPYNFDSIAAFSVSWIVPGSVVLLPDLSSLIGATPDASTVSENQWFEALMGGQVTMPQPDQESPLEEPGDWKIGSWDINHPSSESCGRVEDWAIGLVVAGGGLISLGVLFPPIAPITETFGIPTAGVGGVLGIYYLGWCLPR